MGCLSLLTPHGSQEWNAGYQAWWPVPCDHQAVLICFCDTVSVCSPTWPRTHYVDQVGLTHSLSSFCLLMWVQEAEVSLRGLVASPFPLASHLAGLMFVFLIMVILTGVIWNLELWTLLPPPPKCWNCRYGTLHPVYVIPGGGGTEGRTSCMRASTLPTELHPTQNILLSYNVLAPCLSYPHLSAFLLSSVDSGHTEGWDSGSFHALLPSFCPHIFGCSIPLYH